MASLKDNFVYESESKKFAEGKTKKPPASKLYEYEYKLSTSRLSHFAQPQAGTQDASAASAATLEYKGPTLS
jgi:hypothetical protein